MQPVWTRVPSQPRVGGGLQGGGGASGGESPNWGPVESPLCWFMMRLSLCSLSYLCSLSPMCLSVSLSVSPPLSLSIPLTPPLSLLFSLPLSPSISLSLSLSLCRGAGNVPQLSDRLRDRASNLSINPDQKSIIMEMSLICVMHVRRGVSFSVFFFSKRPSPPSRGPKAPA